jgi:hypothetical protein
MRINDVNGSHGFAKNGNRGAVPEAFNVIVLLSSRERFVSPPVAR